MPVKGIERVKANYRSKTQDIGGRRTDRAVYAVLSQGAAMAATMTPVDTSTLINSQYAPQITQRPDKTVGRVGYTASYAGAVHDAPGTLKGIPRPGGKGQYWDPNAGPGFLTKGFEEIKPSVPAILRAAYRAR